MAAITLTVRDETTAGDTLRELEVQFAVEQVSVRELIRARVHQEVRAHNAGAAGRRFEGLVAPATVDARQVDPEAQTTVALRAFERGNVLVLVDDRQVETLEQTVELRTGSTVTFLKLVPLVGG